jgi:hypothetical protein
MLGEIGLLETQSVLHDARGKLTITENFHDRNSGGV